MPRSEHGFHPQIELGGVSGTELTAVATFIVSLHLKHIRFGLLAMKHYPDICIPQSLTIWTLRDKLVADMADWSGMSAAKIAAAMDALTLRAGEAAYLCDQSLPQMPLLISLENNVLVRPVTSVARNPFIAVTNLLASRDPAVRDSLRSPREDWLRRDLYALFQGNRYACVDGNIKLRKNGKTITDVDAAILDRTTGHLALFQLKWQDFHTNDVRELRSRASNLTRDLDDWAEKVAMWLKECVGDKLQRTFRLNPNKSETVFAVWLFAVSRTAARVHGYGFRAKHPLLAIANWPHFVRIRRQAGPVDDVFPKIHAILQDESSATVEATPLPIEWTVAGQVIRFEDFWSVVPDETIPDLAKHTVS